MIRRPPRDVLGDRVRKLAERRPALVGAVLGRREREPREAVYRDGVLIFADGARLKVMIKSLSRSGARVEFFVSAVLPGEVTLIEATRNLRVHARVAWQRAGAAGLKFIA